MGNWVAFRRFCTFLNQPWAWREFCKKATSKFFPNRFSSTLIFSCRWGTVTCQSPFRLEIGILLIYRQMLCLTVHVGRCCVADTECTVYRAECLRLWAHYNKYLFYILLYSWILHELRSLQQHHHTWPKSLACCCCIGGGVILTNAQNNIFLLHLFIVRLQANSIQAK
jgi:hypothetical protein